MRLIETDAFPFEFISGLAEKESWRKEIHRPIYHVHKWWAKRLGSVFRGILLGCTLEPESDLAVEFYKVHHLPGLTVFDPFMGSGTTIGEAHKLGLAALGRDINPVAVESVRTALGPLDRGAINDALATLSEGVGECIRTLYYSRDSRGRTLRANMDETTPPVVITEQGENRNEREEQWNLFGFPHGVARPCT
jgi:putative DNA methylase